MLGQDEANELLAAFDSGEYSGRIEQAILDGEDRDTVLELLYDRFMEEVREEGGEPGGSDDWTRLCKLGVTTEHVVAWLQHVWEEMLDDVE